jgi:serine protease Do
MPNRNTSLPHVALHARRPVTSPRSQRTSASIRALAAATIGFGLAAGGLALNVPQAHAQLRLDSSGRAPASFADIVEKVKPAVVSIHVRSGGGLPKVAQGGKQGGRGSQEQPGGEDLLPDLPDDHPLKEFFKRFGKQFRGFPSPEPRMAQGSGFFVSADGYVVTNNHVIDGASKIEVAFDEKEKYEADLVGTDPRTDIALLKVKDAPKSFAFVKFSGAEPRVGDWCLAVGNPFGLGGTVTAGIVSALARDIGNGPYDFMQIDAAVNRGNSGGPTFDLSGEVIGVNTAIYSPSGGNVGIAFAVPGQLVSQVIEELKSKGSVSRGWLGVNIQNVSEDVAKGVGMKEAAGAIVSGVTADGPAQKAGLKEGDAIIAVNGQKVADSRDLARKVAGLTPNSGVDVRVVREGREETIKVTLGAFPGANAGKSGKPGKSSGGEPETEGLGLTLGPNTSKKAGTGADGVLVTDVEASSEAATKGIRAGDVIVDVGGKQVNSVADVVTGIKKAREQGREAVLMRVRSEGDTNARFVGLKLAKK